MDMAAPYMDQAKGYLINKSFDKIKELAKGNSTKVAQGNFYMNSMLKCIGYQNAMDRCRCMADQVANGA